MFSEVSYFSKTGWFAPWLEVQLQVMEVRRGCRAQRTHREHAQVERKRTGVVTTWMGLLPQVGTQTGRTIVMAVDDSPHSHAAWLFVLHNILRDDDKVVLLHGVTTNVQVGSAENPGGGFMHAPGAASTGAGELYIMKSQYEESSRLQQSYIDVAVTAAACKVTSQPPPSPCGTRVWRRMLRYEHVEGSLGCGASLCVFWRYVLR
jgi:hypothetical protein